MVPFTDPCIFSIIFYMLIKAETQEALSNLQSASPAVRLLKRFIDDDALRVRFKVVIAIMFYKLGD